MSTASAPLEIGHVVLTVNDLPGLTIRADSDLLAISVTRGIFDR